MLQVSLLGKRRTVFYGWVIVGAGFVVETLRSGIGGQGMGAFLVPLENAFGWSKTAFAAGRSIMHLESGLLGPLDGLLVDRFGPRAIMVVGAVIFGLGMVLLGFVDLLWAYYLSCVVIALGSSLFGSISVKVALNNWFRRRRTFAMSLTETGVGLAGILIVPLLVFVLATFGWRAAAITSGVCIWIVGVPMALLVRRSPESYGALPDGGPPRHLDAASGAGSPVRHDAEPSVDFTLGQAIRTSSFWFLGLGHGMSAMLNQAVIVHQFAHVEQDMGLSSSVAALMVGVTGMAIVVGRVTGGILGDRYDMRSLIAAAMVGMSVALAIFALASALWHILLFGMLYGLSSGMRVPMLYSIRGLYFGRASYGAISGMAGVLSMAGSIIGPIFAGFMADEQGSYVQGFLILAAVCGIGSGFFLLAGPPSKPAARGKRRQGTIL